jgi:serine/threonine protein kinase
MEITMDELQDAIQDARYISAVNDCRPKPTQAINITDDYDMLNARRRDFLRQSSNFDGPLSFPMIVNSYLGYFMFKQFVITINSCSRQMFQYLENIILYQAIENPVTRKNKAMQLYGDLRFQLLGHLLLPDNETTVKQNEIIKPEIIEPSLDDCIHVDTDGSSTLREEPMRKVKESYSGDSTSTSTTTSSFVPTLVKLKINSEKFMALDLELDDKFTTDIFNSTKALLDYDKLVVSCTVFDKIYYILSYRLMEAYFEDFKLSDTMIKYLQFTLLEESTYTKDMFSSYRILGRGGFGSVSACHKKDTGKLYAMKIINKKRIKLKRASKLCWNERKLLGIVNSKFVITLKYAYQTKENLYLILDLKTGGDLNYHLSREGRFSPERAKFYAAQIILGLEHLHGMGIVYRDLKPQNVLLGEEGNCAIADLGLAVQLDRSGRAYGRCGTRGYMAPEMITKNRGATRVQYTTDVDWWSLGCLIYEMLVGCCPFRSTEAKSYIPGNPSKSIDIATLQYKPPMNSVHFDNESRDLLKRLLTRDSRRRLGRGGAFKIKRHPWFDSIDWGMLANGLVLPPWKPSKNVNAINQDRIGEFDAAESNIKLDSSDHILYKGWEYVSYDGVQIELVELLQWEARVGNLYVEHEQCCSIL